MPQTSDKTTVEMEGKKFSELVSSSKEPLVKNSPKSSEKVTTEKKMEKLTLWQDFTSVNLIWVKLINFLHSAGLATIYPFLTVHMRSLGFSAQQTALINFISPLVETAVQIPSGLLADKMGNFRLLAFSVTFLCGISPLAFIFTPSMIPVSSLCCNRTDVFTCYNPKNQTELVNISSLQMDCADKDLGECGHFQFECSYDNQGAEPFASIFAIYLTIRIAVDVLRSSMLVMFGGAFISVIIKHGGDFGRQKLLSPLGGIILGPLAGVLVQYTGDYHSVFGLFTCLIVTSAFLTLKLNLDHKPAARNLFGQALRSFKKYEVFSYVTIYFFLGIFWGFLDNYLFWFLEGLGASKTLMGISVGFGTMAGILLNITSGDIISKIGHSGVLSIALFLYSVRFLGYAYISKPEWTLLLEAFKPFCTTLVAASAGGLIKEAVPEEAVTTMYSVFGAFHYGFGKALGGFIGGYTMEHLDERQAMLVMFVASLSTTVLYIIITSIKKFKNKS